MAMPIDGGSTHPNPVNPYNAATEKTAAARRSYQLRKKLAKRPTGPQGWAGLDQAPMIGQWMNGGQGKTPGKEQHNTSAAGKTRS
jgi:hypothetical protein